MDLGVKYCLIINSFPDKGKVTERWRRKATGAKAVRPLRQPVAED